MSNKPKRLKKKYKQGTVIKVPTGFAWIVSFKQIGKSDKAWLKRYWRNKYNIELPKDFFGVKALFMDANKPYIYPAIKKCIKKPLRQKKLKQAFLSAKELKQELRNDYVIGPAHIGEMAEFINDRDFFGGML